MMRRARTGVLFICAMLAGLAACRAQPGRSDATRVVADTGGYSMRIRVTRPKEQKYELYEVTRTGRAGFSGGADAMLERVPAYLTDLPPDVAERFRDEISKCPWTQAKPEDRGPEGTEPITFVTIGLPDGPERKFTLFGPQPQVDVFVKLIEPVVRRRHDPFLDRLPEATEPPRPKAPAATPAPTSGG